MGVKKNGTKKRKIRGGKPIERTKNFFTNKPHDINNNISSDKYEKDAMDDANDAIHNLKFLFNDVVSQRNSDYKPKTEDRLTEFINALNKKKFINDDNFKSQIRNFLKTNETNFKLLDLGSKTKYINSLSELGGEPEILSLDDMKSVNQTSSTRSSSNLTKNNIDPIINPVNNNDSTSVGNSIHSSSLSSNASEPVSSSSSNSNSSAYASSYLQGSVSLDVNTLPWKAMADIKDPNTQSTSSKKTIKLFGEDKIRNTEELKELINNEKTSTTQFKTDVTNNIKSVEQNNIDLQNHVMAEIGEKQKELDEIKKNLSNVVNTNATLFNARKLNVDVTVKKILAELKKLETDVNERNNFLQKQKDIIRPYIVKNPDIKLSEIITTIGRQPEDLIKAIIICINLNPNIPDTEKYYYVSPDTMLRDVMQDNKLGFIDADTDQTFIDAVKTEFNKGTLQGTQIYTTMFKDAKIKNNANAKANFYKLLNELENVINNFLPIMSKINKASIIAVSGGAIPQFLRSLDKTKADQLRAIYVSYYELTKDNSKLLNNINVENVNEQLVRAINILKYIRISKDGKLVATKDIENLSPGDIVGDNIITDLQYKPENPSPSSNLASGGPALPSSSGGSRKRKSPKKSARKTNKKQ